MKTHSNSLKTIILKQHEDIPKDYTGIVEYWNGNKRWIKNGKYHREDGPSAVWKDGTRGWHINGKLHRTEGPALEFVDSKQWFINNKRHRADGPAIEWRHGSIEYWIDNKPVSQKAQELFNWIFPNENEL